MLTSSSTCERKGIIGSLSHNPHDIHWPALLPATNVVRFWWCLVQVPAPVVVLQQKVLVSSWLLVLKATQPVLVSGGQAKDMTSSHLVSIV